MRESLKIDLDITPKIITNKFKNNNKQIKNINISLKKFAILIIVLILRIIYIKFNTEKIIPAYPLFFILFYTLTYYLTKKQNLALFSSLLLTFFRTLIRYNLNDETLSNTNIISTNNSLFMIALIFPYFLNTYKKKISNKYIKLFNFALLIYVFFSIGEYIVHKYVMHGDISNSIKEYIRKIPILGFQYFHTFNGHIEHHLETKKDMSIDNVKHEHTLYMGWHINVFQIPALVFAILISRKISGFKISMKKIVIISIIVSIIWQYIWNKVHVDMHRLENKYSIVRGAYDHGLMNMSFMTKLLLKNHSLHHVRKGKHKGNYNVIILGADDWFGKNYKTAQIKEPETKEPEIKEPEIKEPETKEPETKEPEIKEPEIKK